MNRKFNIVVAGAGMVGLTVAALLRHSLQQERINLHIVDAGAESKFASADDISLRVSAISLGSVATLSTAGVWDSIASARACPYRDMRVWDARSSVEAPETLRFDAADFAVPQLGFIVENGLIQSALTAELQSLGQPIRFNTAISGLTLDEGRYKVELADGRVIEADLLIGADGSASFVRESAGIDVQGWHYSQTAFVTHLRPEIEHCNTAWQRFLSTGPVALLPLSDGRVSTVWSTTAENALEAQQASDHELARMLGDATDRVLGELTPAGPRGSFPLRAQHADCYVLPGLALVGDAAHCVHPLAGQGVNLGLADAESLAATIAAAIANEEHPGDLPVLRRFERARKGANRTMLHFIDGISRLFANESGSLARLRGGGMRLFNASGPIRRRAVQVALGITR